LPPSDYIGNFFEGEGWGFILLWLNHSIRCIFFIPSKMLLLH
jgi:hypothetical protein